VGLSGAVLYMLNHGLSTGALFLCVGMMYERYHTRSMHDLEGLARRMPVWAFFLGFFTMASVALPGLNGFVSEFMCLLGTFQSGAHGTGGTLGPLGPWFAAVAATGMIVAAIYLLYMVGKVLFGPLREPAGHHAHEVLPPDLNAREIGILVPLALGCIILGVLPTPVIRSIEPANDQLIALFNDAQTTLRAEAHGAGSIAEQAATRIVYADGTEVTMLPVESSVVPTPEDLRDGFIHYESPDGPEVTE
jgi:NADH-quinone oxidoreductase subunit M